MQIGYVGLGNMGGALATRLQKSRSLLVFDRDAQAVARLVSTGARRAESLDEVAAACDVVMLCLPTSDHVRQVLFGDGSDTGLADLAKPGAIFIDQTSGDPLATRGMAEGLSKRGMDLLDAPVSGGIAGAEAGTIAIMVGAERELFDRVRPVFDDISSNVFYAGGVGNGHVIKLVNNLLSGAQRLLTLEAMALAAKNGVDPKAAHAILMAGGGRNAYIEKILGPRVLEGDLNPGFTLGLAHKDVRLACELARASEVPAFFGGLTRELYQLCIAENGAQAQVDTAALLIDRWAGTAVVPRRDET